ncbi:MAG TPA: hypothetical protein VIS72_12730 [Anaerolineales bacterium]
MKKRLLVALGLALVLTIAIVVIGSAVSGAAFTTFNAHVDGAGKDVCKQTAINCNHYGAKEYVWLNGGPTANGLGPDGDYFFAVLEPGGQPNPNDQGMLPDKNLSDDYDCYQNRIFTVTNGEVAAYAGNYDCSTAGYPGYIQFRHWLDNGMNGPKPNWEPPYIRLFPYSDTTNPGGVYIMAICSLDEGYPVDPRDCKYDAFKVRKGKLPYSFMLSGMKFQDTYADGVKDSTAVDPGLSGWTITIKGTGPDGQPIDETVITGTGGYWEWFSTEYSFSGNVQPQPFSLEICEVLQPGWNQSSPTPSCYIESFTPVSGSFDSRENLDFGNWQPVEVTACKDRQNYDGSTTSVEGWLVSRTEEGVVVDTQPTGANGCYTWYDLPPGITYDVHEEEKAGWMALGPVDFVFEKAKSGKSYSHTFVNQPLEGCTPGFWQGGNGFETAGGKWYWNEFPDEDWAGSGDQPYDWGTEFCGFFGCAGNIESMWHFVNPEQWEVNNDFHKAARSLVAGYLNASWGIGYPYTTGELQTMWTAAYNGGTLLALHTELDAANNAYYRDEPPAHCPISASGY